MRVILDATGKRESIYPLLDQRPSPLLGIAGKPILFHLFETLHWLGLKRCDLILNHHAEQIAQLVGRGNRWGLECQCHRLTPNQNATQAMRLIAETDTSSNYLIGVADMIPYIPPQYLHTSLTEGPKLLLTSAHDWSGWGLFSTASIKTLSPQNLGNYEMLITSPNLSVQTYSQLKQCNQEALIHKNLVFPATAGKKGEQLWISQGAHIHPSAELIPPLFIGSCCHIGKGVSLGPHTLIEDHCFIDDHTEISDALICENSFVGERLSLHNCIVDQKLLIHLAHNAQYTIDDPTLLGKLVG